MASARSAVQQQLRTAAARLPDLFAPGTRLVVGYSGGQDSTCLLHALTRPRLGLEVVAAHVDHGLRKGSDDDARVVAGLATSLGAQIEVVHLDVAAYRQQAHGWSLQQAARAARYQALASVVDRHAAAAVVVAHTADDLAETFLLNLVRGAGLAGLASMRLDETFEPLRLGPRVAGVDRSGSPMRLVRPLLRVERATTLAYCSELELAIVEDASNASRTYTRNRVRLDLLPLLERFNPAIRGVLARTADLATEDLAALDAVVRQLHALVARAPEPGVLEYNLDQWHAQPRALQRRLLRHGLAVLLGDLADVRASPVEDALEVLTSGHPERTYHLPYGVELRCTRSDTFLLRLQGRARPRARQNTRGSESSPV